MNERNPYAPPQAVVEERPQADCAREGKWAVVATGSDLPPRCIVCNAPARLPVKKVRVSWHNPWIYVLLLVNILVYVIAAVIARKSADLHVGLCEQHTARRRLRVGICLGLAAACLAWGGIQGVTDPESDYGLPIALSLLPLLVSYFVGRRVYASRITQEYVRIGGCKEPFLASLGRDQPGVRG